MLVKKKFDSARRDYDQAIQKVQLLQKEKKPNPPKISAAESDRDKLKQVYMARGEEAFTALLDTNEMSEYTALERASRISTTVPNLLGVYLQRIPVSALQGRIPIPARYSRQ